MTDMESLDRAVEEAWGSLERVADRMLTDVEQKALAPHLDALIAAVDARARAEERESRILVVYCRHCSWSREADSGRWAEELRMRHEQVNETHNAWITDRARFSEEAGDG